MVSLVPIPTLYFVWHRLSCNVSNSFLFPQILVLDEADKLFELDNGGKNKNQEEDVSEQEEESESENDGEQSDNEGEFTNLGI